MTTPPQLRSVDPGSVQLRHIDDPYQNPDQLTRLYGINSDEKYLESTNLIERFTSRYTNPKTAHQYRVELSALFAYTGAGHPRALTDAGVNHYVAQARANNTRRNRLARICTFLRWCVRQGGRCRPGGGTAE